MWARPFAAGGGQTTQEFHQYFIKKYTECWVPDVADGVNLSGKLSHENSDLKNIKFIGPLTRFKKRNLAKKNNLINYV